MNGSGDELFARAGFTLNQDCRRRRRHARDLLQNRLQGSALAHDLSEIEVFHTRHLVRNGLLNRIQQILIVEWLGKEFNRSSLHGADGHRDVSVTSDENDRDLRFGGSEFPLEVEPAQTRQPHVQHKAAGPIRAAGLQKFLRRSERLDSPPDRPDETLNGFTHRRIVINHEHDGDFLVHGTFPLPLDRRNAALDSVHKSAHIRRAEWTALSRASSLNGLRRKSIAPPSNASLCSASLPCAVTKMMGTRRGAALSCRWSSRPLIPGNRRSTSRHAADCRQSVFRRSSAEANVSTLNPTDRMRLFSA